MKSRLVALLQRLNGWRLWGFFALAAVVVAEAIVSLMGLLLLGRIPVDYLLTGLVAAGIVAPCTLYLMNALLRELSGREQERLEHGMQSAETRLKVALDASDEGILMVDQSGRVLSANKRFHQMWRVPDGLAAQENDGLLLAHVLDQLLEPDSFLEGVKRLYSGGADAMDTLHFKDGRVFERYTRALSFGTGHGRIWCFRDVSRQVHTQAALAAREEIYSAIVNRSAEGILLVDAETMAFTEFNDAACSGLGYTREEFAALRLCDVQGEMNESQTLEKCRVAAATPDGLRFDNRHRCKDGSLRRRHISNRPVQIRGRTYLAHVWHDVTERKLAEEALAESRNLLQAVIDTVPMRIFWKDRDLRYMGCNPAFAADAGKPTPADIIGSDDHRLAWAEQADRYRADDLAVMESGKPKLSFEEPQSGPDGRTTWLRTSKVPLRNRRNEIIGVLGIYDDITQRKQLTDALRLREQYQRAVLDNFPFMVWLKDEQSRFLAVNQAFVRGFGQTSAEALVGRTDFDIAPAGLAEGYRADDAAVLRSGRPKNVEEQILTDGQLTWFETYKSPISIGGQVIGTVGFARDITERKRMERHLTLAVEAARAILWEADLQSGRLAYDATTLPVLGIDPQEAPATLDEWSARVHPEDRTFFLEGIEKSLQQGNPDFNIEYRLRNRDGAYHWIHTQGRVIERGAAGEPRLAVGTSTNINERRKTNEELRASEQRSGQLATLLRLMCDNVPDMIWAKDMESRYLFANKAFCRQLLKAVDTDEPLGKNDLYFALRERGRHPQDPNWHTFGELRPNTDAITLENGRPSVFEESGMIAGKMTYLDVHKAPFVNDNGEIIGIVGSARDITERKQMDAELESHRSRLEELVRQRTSELLQTEARATRILESTADGLYGVDLAGRVTFINPAGCRMLGYRADEVIGRVAEELFGDARIAAAKPAGGAAAADGAPVAGGAVHHDDLSYRCADGTCLRVAVSVHPMVEAGRATGAVYSFVDMSVHHAAALAREQALVAAESLAKARSEFLANMSHEIRTPMNGMLGFAHIGLRNHDDAVKARNAFSKIIASGDQLLGVVNQILDFSKIDAGQLQVEAADVQLDKLLADTIDLVAERAAAKGLVLTLDKSPDFPAACTGDPLRIGQILLNLLSNAVKFTQSGSVVLAARRDGADLVFRVTDTGIGMTGEQLSLLFNPFQQADGSTTRRFGGTGLGLAICRRLLELMHGDICAESQPDRGSSFEFRIPYIASVRGAASRIEDGPVASAGRVLAGLSILLADDDEINREVLELNLEEQGVRLVMVENGREAVERVRRDGAAAYDVVLMDIQMPELNGYDATRQIHEFAPELPIIGATAFAFAEERDKCLAAGMVAHIAKPIEFAALVRLLAQVVGRQGAD